jgi:5'-deoxynucleotidase YfbR-like HD superfamily hydrolase
MQKQTLDKLEAAFEAVGQDLSGRVAELAAKSTSGKLSQEEQSEYEQIVRLNDLLSLLKLQAEEYWSPRLAS